MSEAKQKKPGPVGWLLAGALVRKASRIARAMIANEMDMRDWMTHDKPPNFSDRPDLWFEYIADTGDDWAAMRALAAQMAKPLTLPYGGVVHTMGVGAFVFVGGDTAYHIADEMTLRQRFVDPFVDGIGNNPAEPRKLYGIPGNHDYYDNLVGFNRLFRKPLEGDESVLPIARHTPDQEASYVRIELPGEWELWGVDLGPHGLDYRQAKYFHSGARPNKLILCVPTPPVTYDRVRVSVGDEEDPEYRAYKRLFGHEADPKVIEEMDPAKVARDLPVDSCRLHMGGDDHNYQRYGGGDDRPIKGDVQRSCAAAVVSGGGGAFMHPTETTHREVERVKSYPTPAESRQESAKHLIDPRTIWRGGYVWLVGGLLAAALYLTFPRSWAELGPPAAFCGALASSVAFLWGAHRSAVGIATARKNVAKRQRSASTATVDREQAREEKKATRHVRSVWPLAIVGAIGSPFAARAIWSEVDPLSLPTVFLMITVVFAIVLTMFGRGGAGVETAARSTGFTLLGALHAIVQLGLAMSLLLAGSWLGVAIWLGATILYFAAAPSLYRAQQPWWLLLLWFAQGPASVILLWVLRAFDAPLLVVRNPWLGLVAFVIGMFVAVTQYGWYMLMASAFQGHNNEVGAANRIARYKQWIRFHVTEGRLTGYVISVEDPGAASPEPKIVDVFYVEPKRA